MLHKKIIWVPLSAIIVLLTTWLLLTRLLFPLMWDFLVVDEVPQPSDVIIVPSGGEGKEGRTEYGIELYMQGYADFILFSGGNEARSMGQTALKEGVAEDHILLDTKSSTTYDNACNSTDIMQSHNLRSAIIVTSAYHTRRVSLIFEQYLSTDDLTICAVPYDSSANHWWESAHLSKVVILEYVKLDYHYLLK